MTNRIPKHFHFIFGLKEQTSPFHLAYFLCLKSCIEINNPDRISFYYHYEPFGQWWEAIKHDLELVHIELESFVTQSKEYEQHTEGQFIQREKLNYAHQADFIRLRALIEHGGIYADMDTLFVNPMPPSFYNHDFLIGTEGDLQDDQGEAQQSLCNALMLSTRGSEYAQQWLTNMHEVFDGSWSKHSCQEASRLALEKPHTLTIVPKHHFYKHSFDPQGIKELFEETHTAESDVYSMHLWNHLWWEEKRVDFSPFNHRLLTQEYVRNAKSTYASIAKQFMPAPSTPFL